MEQFNTPMMKQYERIKKEYHDCLLFFRMGDFYELFLEDAYVGSKVLQITLTSRSKGKDGRIPMAGVPYHAVDSYIAKLVRAGYKVAICEQVSEPNKYGIVDREVIRIITPGTVLDEKMLEKKENNYIMCLNITDKSFAIAAADISTGQFQTDEYSTINFTQPIVDELIRLNPAECILPEKLYNNASILKLLKTLPHLNIFYYPEWNTYSEQPKKYLESFFKVKSLDMFSLENKKAAQEVASVLLGYLTYTQKGNISHIKKITTFNSASHMTLDRSTIINLELFSTIRESEKKVL
jgi:DNA mismatch repair protein MutS